MSAEASSSALPPMQPLVDKRLVIAWFSASLFWVIVAPVLGLVAAMKLDDPTFMDGIEWWQFGRLRIAHVNGVIFGFFSTALIGFMCYAVPKLCGRPMASPRACWAGWGLFNLVILVGESGLLAGYIQPVEAGEYGLLVDIPLVVSYLLISVPVLQTIATRKHERMYVSLWYWVAGLLWTGINFILGIFILPSMKGVTSAAMHGFYLHNVVGLWITPMGLGIAYYLLPVSARARLYSHRMSLIGFWGLAFFYALNGIHHYIYSPIAEWAQTIAIAASMMLILPVWAFSINMWGTMRGKWSEFVGDNYTVKFVMLGAIWYLITCFQGPLEALRGMQRLTHFGDFNVGHAHSAVFGVFAIWGMAAIYYVLPRIVGRHMWSTRLAAWHYWLEIFGFGIMFGALTVSGFVQGSMLLTYDVPWIETVNQIRPYWVVRTLGGTLMDLGLAFFVFNMVMTVLIGKRVSKDQVEPAVEPPTPSEETATAVA